MSTVQPTSIIDGRGRNANLHAHQVGQVANNEHHHWSTSAAVSTATTTMTSETTSNAAAAGLDSNNSDDWETLSSAEEKISSLTVDQDATSAGAAQVRFHESGAEPLAAAHVNQPSSTPGAAEVAATTRSTATRTSLMKHCLSTPDLRHLHIHEEVDDEDDDDIEETKGGEDTDDESGGADSYSLVSGPPSVHSAASASATTVATKPKMSYRDMMIRSASMPIKDGAAASTTPPRKTVRKFKAKFVVTPIKRCAKSTGDLTRLARESEDDYDDDVLGDTDAHEFYSRKAHGAAGRRNGLKSRPDEAKRLQMTMAKKSMQRQRQQNR